MGLNLKNKEAFIEATEALLKDMHKSKLKLEWLALGLSAESFEIEYDRIFNDVNQKVDACLIQKNKTE